MPIGTAGASSADTHALSGAHIATIPMPAGYYDRVIECAPKRHSSETDAQDTVTSQNIFRSGSNSLRVHRNNAAAPPLVELHVPGAPPHAHQVQSAETQAGTVSGDDSHLERAKSISSVSSATSTSSLEAAPFRAPPRGNLRSPQKSHVDLESLGKPAPPIESAVPTSSQYPLVPGRHRIPKPMNDDWVFRNGPGVHVIRSTPKMPSSRFDAHAEADPLSSERRFRPLAWAQSPDSSDEEGEGPRTMLTPEMVSSPAASVFRKHPSRPSSSASSRASYVSRGSVATIQARPNSTADSLDTSRRDALSASILTPPAPTGTSRTDDVPHFDRLPAAERPTPRHGLTPAEVVRMEARAGVARAPSSPSFPQPGGSLAPYSPVVDDNCTTTGSIPSSRVSDVSSTTPTLAPTKTENSGGSHESVRSQAREDTYSDARPRISAPLPPLPVERPLPAVPHPASQRSKRTPADFVFGEVLGEGSYSTVLKAWDVHDIPSSERDGGVSALQAVAGLESTGPGTNSKAYAVKVLDKVHILREKKQKYVGIEKEALSLLLHHPGITSLYWTFQDRESLYFVLELAPSGELIHYIQQLGSLDMTSATFYAAQLADAIDGIHAAGVIHRDIKPENVLLGEDMHIRITDFGSARILSNKTELPQSGRMSSFVGTADYVSPELLGEKPVGPPSDWWAFGCVVYQMLAGKAPFRATNEYQTFQRIIRRSFSYPACFSQVAIDFIDPLLALDPMMRPTASRIKTDPFFANISFSTIWIDTPPPMKQGGIAPPEMSSASLARGLEELESTFERIPVPLAGDTNQVDSMDSSSSLRGTDFSASAGGDSSDEEGGDAQNESNGQFGVLLPNEMLLYSSPIKLRKTGARKMFSKRCQLLLTNFPRLLCISDTQASRVLSDIRLIPSSDAPSDRVESPTPSSGSLSSSKQKQTLQFQPIQAFSRGLMRMNSQIAHVASGTGSLRSNDDATTEQAEQVDSSRDPVISWLVHCEIRGRREFVISTVCITLTSLRDNSSVKTRPATQHSGFSVSSRLRNSL